MYHDIDEYPYNYKTLPDVGELIDMVEWDVLCVFDACRWDAYTEVCNNSEPVSSPGSNTPKWTDRVWCNDKYDWSDVTYISGNPHVTATREGPESGNDWSGKIEEHVGEYVTAYKKDDIWGVNDPVSQPEALTELAVDYDPPLVVHYLQPHTPFIGNVACQLGFTSTPERRGEYIGAVDDRFGDFPTISIDEKEITMLDEYYLSITGLVEPEYIRLAYLSNLERAWKAARTLRNEFETVISTADHGERLGLPTEDRPNPDDDITLEQVCSWGHDEKSDQGRVIPFDIHTRSEDSKELLPDAQSVGAADTHEWVLEKHQ